MHPLSGEDLKVTAWKVKMGRNFHQFRYLDLLYVPKIHKVGQELGKDIKCSSSLAVFVDIEA